MINIDHGVSIGCMATIKPILNFPVDVALLKRLDDFRFSNRFESRADAIRWLLTFALDKKPRPDAETSADCGR